jgi:hypothetical protein
VAVVLMGRSRRAASVVGTTQQIFEVMTNIVVCPTETFAVDEKTLVGTLLSAEMSVGYVRNFLPTRDRRRMDERGQKVRSRSHDH